ncbi:oxidoreductase [candidate division KSB1 bacterium]|nr:oxidoreductase [candidate division KSB1 bacterium]
MTETVALFFQIATFFVALLIGLRVMNGETFSALGGALYIDGLSSFITVLVSFMVILVVLQSFRYMQREKEHGSISEGRISIYYGLILLFTASMMGTCTTNHLVMLFVTMEFTTLSSAFLVAFYRQKASLEAGYKYILLVVVGMSFSLMGIVIIFASALPLLGSIDALLLTELGRVARTIPRNYAVVGIALMTVGFATKAGLVPFHAWLPDAHSEAPTPISALLSGLIIKLGAYALARTVTIFSPYYHVVMVFIAILASISMVVGIMMALVQDDLKRMLAFSSVSQISYVFEGLGLGTYLGIYGGLFHLLNHTLIKSLLFMSVAAIMFATHGKRKISELGGLARKMPITAFCFFVGALAISGLPPFNGFHSKFTIFLAVGEQKLYWAMVISIFTGLLTLATLVWAGYRVFWRKPAEEVVVDNPVEVKEVPVLMWISIVILALLCISIGIYPKIVHPLVNTATHAILSILNRPI